MSVFGDFRRARAPRTRVHPTAAGATHVHASPGSPPGPQAVARGAEASIYGRIRRVCTGLVRLGCTGEAPTAGKQARRAPFRRPSVFWSRDKMSRRNASASLRSWARRRCRPCWCRFRGAGRRRPSCSCRAPRSPDARASGAPVIGRERASEPLWTSRGVAAPHTGSERPPPIDENRAKVVNLVPSSTGPEPRAISESPRGPVRRSSPSVRVPLDSFRAPRPPTHEI